MPDIELPYGADFSNQKATSTQSRALDYLTSSHLSRNCSTSTVNDLMVEQSDNANLGDLNRKFSSSLQMNEMSIRANSTSSPAMFSPCLDFNSTTIEIDPNLDLHKDNHLIEFNQLEDIFRYCNPRNTIESK